MHALPHLISSTLALMVVLRLHCSVPIRLIALSRVPPIVIVLMIPIQLIVDENRIDIQPPYSNEVGPPRILTVLALSSHLVDQTDPLLASVDSI